MVAGRIEGKAGANKFPAASDGGSQGGQLKATVGGSAGFARIRIIPAFPYSEDFSNVPVDKAPTYWLNTDGAPIKYTVREVDGNKFLVKKPDNGIFKRTRSPFGAADASNYTIEADVRAIEKRRQMGDAGVVAQRYELVLFGNLQKIELRSWQIEEKRTFSKPFAWADTWYRLKLQVEICPAARPARAATRQRRRRRGTRRVADRMDRSGRKSGGQRGHLRRQRK